MVRGGWPLMIGIKTLINFIFVKFSLQIGANFLLNQDGLAKRIFELFFN